MSDDVEDKELLTMAAEKREAVRAMLAKDEQTGFALQKNKDFEKHYQAARIRLQSLDFRNWPKWESMTRWENITLACALESQCRFTIDEIGQIIGASRVSIWRWKKKNDGKSWAYAKKRLKNSHIDHLTALSRVALERALNEGAIRDQLRAAEFVLTRNDADFLDPKHKLEYDARLNDTQAGNPLSGASPEALRKLLIVLENPDFDMESFLSSQEPNPLLPETERGLTDNAVDSDSQGEDDEEVIEMNSFYDE